MLGSRPTKGPPPLCPCTICIPHPAPSHHSVVNYGCCTSLTSLIELQGSSMLRSAVGLILAIYEQHGAYLRSSCIDTALVTNSLRFHLHMGLICYQKCMQTDESVANCIDASCQQNKLRQHLMLKGLGMCWYNAVYCSMMWASRDSLNPLRAA